MTMFRQTILELWQKGLSVRDIAKALGTSTKSVSATASKLRASGFDLPPHNGNEGQWRPLEQRFREKVDIRGPQECWPWTGKPSGSGYGRLRTGGRQGKLISAHRLAYMLDRGDIPEGLVIDHLCGNRMCVNPAHLEAVTNAENVRRGRGPNMAAYREGRCVRGHPRSESYTYKGAFHYCRICRRERESANR